MSDHPANPPSRVDIQIIRADALKAVPWKNGGGVTREIARYPAGASLESFIWRVSAAQVGLAGPFSRFNDIDRIVVLTHGESITLINTATGERRRLQRWEPFEFLGETPIRSELPDGPGRDFNLMVRRGQGHGRLDVWKTAQTLTISVGSTILHCAAGAFSVRPMEADLQSAYLLQTGDTLHLSVSDGATLNLDIAPAQAGGTLIDARITLSRVAQTQSPEACNRSER